MKHDNTSKMLTNVIGGGNFLPSLITSLLFVACSSDDTPTPPELHPIDTYSRTAADSTAADSTAVSTTTIVVDTTWAEVMEYNYDGTPAADTLNINVPTDGDISEGNPDDAA